MACSAEILRHPVAISGEAGPRESHGLRALSRKEASGIRRSSCFMTGWEPRELVMRQHVSV